MINMKTEQTKYMGRPSGTLKGYKAAFGRNVLLSSSVYILGM